MHWCRRTRPLLEEKNQIKRASCWFRCPGSLCRSLTVYHMWRSISAVLPSHCSQGDLAVAEDTPGGRVLFPPPGVCGQPAAALQEAEALQGGDAQHGSTGGAAQPLRERRRPGHAVPLFPNDGQQWLAVPLCLSSCSGGQQRLASPAAVPVPAAAHGVALPPLQSNGVLPHLRQLVLLLLLLLPASLLTAKEEPQFHTPHTAAGAASCRQPPTKGAQHPRPWLQRPDPHLHPLHLAADGSPRGPEGVLPAAAASTSCRQTDRGFPTGPGLGQLHLDRGPHPQGRLWRPRRPRGQLLLCDEARGGDAERPISCRFGVWWSPVLRGQ